MLPHNGNARHESGRNQAQNLLEHDTEHVAPQEIHAEEKSRRSHSVLIETPLRHERIVAFFRWKHQAEGMLSRFWQTGDVRALCAFVVHVIAMRRRLKNEIEGRSL